MTLAEPNIRFRDLNDRQEKAYADLNYAFRKLEDIEKSDRRTLSAAEQRQKDDYEEMLKVIDASRRDPGKVDENPDALFVAARTLLNEQVGIEPELRGLGQSHLLFGEITSAKQLHEAIKTGKLPDVETALVGLMMGLLIVDRVSAPPLTVVKQEANFTGSLASGNPHGQTLYPQKAHPLFSAFTKDFFGLLGEARSYGTFADRVLKLLSEESDPDGSGPREPKVSVEEFAKVMRGLTERKIQPAEPQLRRRINEVLDDIQRVKGSDAIPDLGIDLPDLNEFVETNIIAENVRVMGPMIVSAMFEELKVFQAVDKIVEQFQHGMLPIGHGKAGKLLYNYWREAPNRMSEQERRNFAAITLGVPGGEPGAMVNREFNDLWLRFVSSVSNYVRQSEVDQMLRARIPNAISQQQVRKAARDLASNLSLHGYGMAHYAGRELQSQITGIIDLLKDPEILGAYGARDMWQVVDQIATYDLGGARTSSRYITLATCGTIITAWLANNTQRIRRPTEPIIDMSVVRFPDTGQVHKATLTPNDYDLVNACELWLADTATSDLQVEELSQPREAPTMTSKPIPIPTMARQMLNEMGDIGLGMSNGGAPAGRWH
jgi:hypothetical protein